MAFLLHAKSSRKVGFSCSVEEGTDVPRHQVAPPAVANREGEWGRWFSLQVEKPGQ
jgi:hypothetical protein